MIVPLCASFNVGKHAEKDFQYVGLHIVQIYVDQIEYLNGIAAVDMDVTHRGCKTDFCSPAEASSFRKLVGMLNWVASQTRPDLSFDVCRLSSCMANPTVADILKANKVLGKVKQSPLRLVFPKLENLSESNVIVYTDASLANLPNGKSVGGYIVFLVWQTVVVPLCGKVIPSSE